VQILCDVLNEEPHQENIHMKDNTSSLKDIRLAAENGLAYSQYVLGGIYYSGEGVPQDYAEAVKWFRKAALQGEVYAQYNLGWMYETGTGVPQDYAEAAIWYRMAAQQGNANALTRLDEIKDK
jgi:TPR repeat protein